MADEPRISTMREHIKRNKNCGCSTVCAEFLDGYRDCRAQLEVMTRERDRKEQECIALAASHADRVAELAELRGSKSSLTVEWQEDDGTPHSFKAQCQTCDSLRAQMAEAQSQFRALQEHMGKSGPWPKQVEVDGAYWRPQVETLRAQLEEVTKALEGARITAHQWQEGYALRVAERDDALDTRDRLAARMAKLEAICERFADAVRSGSDEVTGEAMREWDAAVKPEQP